MLSIKINNHAYIDSYYVVKSMNYNDKSITLNKFNTENVVKMDWFEDV